MRRDDMTRKNAARAWFGKTVRIVIDRPLGTVHPNHPDIRYPINYGYIPGTEAGDGEPWDVYLLGVNMPMREYTCRIIGSVLRENDTEDKLVAAPLGLEFHQAQIAEAVYFQERFFRSKIDAIYHRSCGALLYRNLSGTKEYLLLRQAGSGTWSFPKGHMEKYETEQETAMRELVEETGIAKCCFTGFKTKIGYRWAGIFHKTVVLYAACTEQEPALANLREIREFRWVTATEATGLLRPNRENEVGMLEAIKRFEALPASAQP